MRLVSKRKGERWLGPMGPRLTQDGTLLVELNLRDRSSLMTEISVISGFG